MERYKIGQVAQFLNLSSETLRYYEKLGIISSQRDDENSYRYYSAWDINYLLDCTYYRSFGFPVRDVKRMVQQDNLDGLVSDCEHQLQELAAQLNQIRFQMESLFDFKQALLLIESKIGRFELAQSPEVFFQKHRRNNVLLANALDYDGWAYWNNLKPHIKNTFFFPNRAADGGLENEYYWGYSVPVRSVGETKNKHLESARYIRSFKSLYTVFKAYGENTFYQEIIAQVMSMQELQNYRVSSSPIIGNLLARVHDGDQFVRYCEVWIPIES